MKFKTKAMKDILLDVVEHGHDIVWATDTNLIIVYFNEAIKNYGWERKELVGRSMLDIMDTKSRDLFKITVAEYLPTCRKSNCVRIIETTNFFSNMKDTFIVESACKLLYDDTGEIAGFYGTARDITNKKKLDRINLENERLKAIVEVAGGVCHEASQPLQIMSGYIDLLDTTELDDESAKYLRNLRVSMERLSGIIRKIQSMENYKTRTYLTTNIIDIK